MADDTNLYWFDLNCRVLRMRRTWEVVMRNG